MNFTFAAIDIGVTLEEKNAMLNEVLSLPDDVHHYNAFRGCKMIAIYNGGGRLGSPVKGIDTQAGKFKYTKAGDLCPTMKKVIEEKMFPWLVPHGRVTILRTAPDTGLNVHLDSQEKEIGTLQYKYRLVLNGAIGKLYFIDEDYNKVYVPDLYDSYVLDGSHAHSIDPDTKEKITICVGAPWHGEPNESYNKMILNAKFKMEVSRPQTKPGWLDPGHKK